jgi:hypothetical protein
VPEHYRARRLRGRSVPGHRAASDRSPHEPPPGSASCPGSADSPSCRGDSPAGMNSSAPSSRTSRNFSSLSPSKSGTWRSSSSVATVNSIPSATHFHLRSAGGLYPLCAEHFHHLLLLMCGASCKYDAIHRNPMPSLLRQGFRHALHRCVHWCASLFAQGCWPRLTYWPSHFSGPRPGA